jgi:hypothetical protein
MGIEFAGLPDDSKRRFQDHLDKMDPGFGGQGRPDSGKDPE